MNAGSDAVKSYIRNQPAMNAGSEYVFKVDEPMKLGLLAFSFYRLFKSIF